MTVSCRLYSQARLRLLVWVKFSTLVSMLFMQLAVADEISLSRVLTIDRPLMKAAEIHFDNPSRIKPKDSDFKILSYYLMSSEAGDREAVLTIENTSNGQRFLEKEHLLAVYADGEFRYPHELKEKFSGGERLTLRLSLPANAYPILSIYTSNDL